MTIKKCLSFLRYKLMKSHEFYANRGEKYEVKGYNSLSNNVSQFEKNS